MSKIYDGKQLPDVMHKWQHVLHLDAWDIRIKLCRQSEMLDPNVQGENNWTLATRQSVIHVLDPVDYPADTEFEQDMEQTVVHELLHLHFDPFEPEDDMGLAYLAMEQTIELLARVLTGKNCDACSCKPDIEKIAHGIVEQITRAEISY